MVHQADDIQSPHSYHPSTLAEAAKDGEKILRFPADFPQLPSTNPPTHVDATDLQTPDNWIKRDSRLIRLTGKHPFNSEAPLKELFDAGFLTPPELFYVRNHGAVPRIEGDTLHNWSIRVHGLVERERSFTLNDLKTLFPVVTLPITLVCAGNRRKEQNVVRKGLGFNWGAAALSTALWTGVYLADILNYVKPNRRKARHVIFEGADSLPKGPYGTSQHLSRAMDRDKGMLIAWRMNGLPLEPDHGFPVRLVVPGQIGGRSVKWLRKIEISSDESQHHLHFWDNKVLPTQVMPEQARAEAHWWYNPLYIIYDVNVNSVIAKPNHEEMLLLPRGEDNKGTLYTVQGYAYSGGGRRVARVEISLDQGSTWSLTSVTYPEDLYRLARYQDPVYGTIDLTDRETCFCWCFWKIDVLVSELAKCSAVIVRAMDESLGAQPKDMYWNVTGMMNNWWFRVAVHQINSDDGASLRFEHPTLAGIAPGGWMPRTKEADQDVLNPSFGNIKQSSPPDEVAKPRAAEVVMTKQDVQRKITMVELRDKSRPLFVVKGEVYDGTGFLDQHPGGAESILISAGEDVTDDFMAIHSPEGKMKLAMFHIGTLDVTSKIPKELSIAFNSKADVNGVFLHKTKWKTTRLAHITTLSHDSFVFRFELEHRDQPLGLPVGQHVFVRLRRKGTGELVQRAYTPVSRQQDRGFIDLLVKVYFPSAQFPAGGKMTNGFHELVAGDTVEMKGPLGSFTWKGRGMAVWKGEKRQVKNVGLICGGSGITPILQVLRAVLQDEDDKETRLWLLDSNKTEQDILCREELDSLSRMYNQKPNRFLLHHTLGRASRGWTSSTGRICDKMLAVHMPPPGDDTLILTCGPEAMMKMTVKPGLERLGWNVARSLVMF